MSLPSRRYSLAAGVVLASCLSCCVALNLPPRPSPLRASSPPAPVHQSLPPNHTLAAFINGFVEHAVRTSPLNETVAAVFPTLVSSSPGAGRSAETLYLASFFKIAWQFVNGIAKPFLKTYLVPIQMLFTYMAPRMFLRDCFNVDSTALLSARSLSPFTIPPFAQNFFTCAVDIIAQVILCVKLLANMAPSIF